jgi:ParB family transcriptional regulator, chromosome partitioning protein
MNDDPSRRRLGRGLAALIGEIDKVDKPAVVHKWAGITDGQTPIEFVHPNPRNPRRAFGDSDLTDLAQSIKEHGIVQPVVVRPSGSIPGNYEIIAGERRWRAAQRAGLTEVPIIVREVNDRTALELAIIENVQRTDLNPVEEALGYQQLIDDHNYTQADLGQVIGKSRSHVANTLRLLKLPEDIQGLLIDGALSAGHARTLVTAPDPARLARRIVEEGLSVRQAEMLAQLPIEASTAPPPKQPAEKDADTLALEKLLSNITGLKVAINHKQKGGELRIAYSNLEQLDDLCRRLKA